MVFKTIIPSLTRLERARKYDIPGLISANTTFNLLLELSLY
jgi:hypothetical protein